MSFVKFETECAESESEAKAGEEAGAGREGRGEGLPNCCLPFVILPIDPTGPSIETEHLAYSV